jgi:hypothetical protein
MRAEHRQTKDLQSLLDNALRLYGPRILDNVDLDRLPDLRSRAAVAARAMIDRGDARAFAMGRKMLDRVTRVSDEEWGARLHQADTAINKVLAAAGRSKARDIADLVAIGRDYCPLGPLVLAAAGKPPNFSPRRTIDEIRRHALSIPADEFAAVRGLPPEWSAAFIRDELLRLIEAADRYVMSAPPELTGMLAVGKAGVPIEVSDSNRADAILRKPTVEPEVMSAPAAFNAIGWTPDRP